MARPRGCGNAVLVAAALVVVFLLAACQLRAPSSWPDRGPFVRVDNPDAFPIYVEARDGVGRMWRWGKVKPGKSGCWRWPFALTADGTITAYRAEEVSVVKFHVWAPGVHFWRWTPGEDSVRVAKDYCE